jgi:antitoxin (DNA-binding transcriptional repressor) of toxin-antitoxin stability system
MKTLNVSDFREQCLQLLDGLPADGILITKRGRPVAKLLPVPSSCSDLIGIMKGLSVNPQDELLSTGVVLNLWQHQPVVIGRVEKFEARP